MKCRRSKSSRGARLRGAARNAGLRKPAVPAARPDAAAPTAAGAPPGLLRIDGPAKGAIDHNGTVIVGRHGTVTGNLSATIIIVEGQVEGDLQATQALRILASARIVGDLCAPRLAVARGASLRGRIATRRPASSAGEIDDRAVSELLAGA
jgi:hypothetical protein